MAELHDFEAVSYSGIITITIGCYQTLQNFAHRVHKAELLSCRSFSLCIIQNNSGW